MASENDTKINFAYAFANLLNHKPVEKITITELCHYANYSRETFYYHFKDKYDLMSWIYYAQISWHVDKYYGKEDFYIMISRTEKGIKNLKNFYVNGFLDYRYEGLENAMIEHTVTLYTKMLKLAINEDILDEEKKFLIQFNAAGSVYMVKYWLTNDNPLTHREFARLIVDSMSPELSNIFKSYKREGEKDIT